MIKTCLNCKYYHTIEDCTTGEHWHHFCSRQGRILKPNEYYSLYMFDDINDIVYDDFETGVAECYLFEPLPKETYSDDWYTKNKKHNDFILNSRSI